MRKIDDRLTLNAADHAALDASPYAGLATDPQTGLSILAVSQAAAGGAIDVAGDDKATTLADPVHTTLALPGIGLGYASLDSMEDKDNALLFTSTGLEVITSGVQGYLVKSSTPMDAALSKILAFDHFGGLSETNNDLAALRHITFAAGMTLDPGHSTGFEVTGTTSADSILASNATDIIHGGSGNDSIDGGGGDDIAWGDLGNDSMTGGSGNDQLWGSGGLDTLVGGLGDDFLFGGSGNDSVLGGDGNDLVLGGTGNDVINGGDGDDVLVGGGGADTLIGGAGHDLFIFAEGDSGVGVTGQDQVSDFTVGEDKLDLTSFTQPLHMVATFDGHAYEMTLTDRDDGTLVSIDLNGDGVADQTIVVITSDHSHLSGSDYVI